MEEVAVPRAHPEAGTRTDEACYLAWGQTYHSNTKSHTGLNTHLAGRQEITKVIDRNNRNSKVLHENRSHY